MDKKYQSHFSQTDSGGEVTVKDGLIKWKVDDPRSKTLHDRDDIGMGSAQYVPGWWGGNVLTNTGLLTFITAMERLISQFGGSVINCTEGGCYLDGAKRMFLQDAISKYCKESIDKSALTPLLTLHPDADKRIKEALPLLQNDIKNLETIIDNAEKGLATDIKMRNAKGKGKLKKLLNQNAAYSIAAHETAKKSPTVELAILWASRKIQSRHLNIEAEEAKVLADKDKLLIRIDRNEIILKAARDAAKELMKTYKETEKAFVDYIEGNINLEPTGEITPPDLSDADYYLSIGNFAKPLLEARRAGNQEIINRAIAAREIKIAIAKEIQQKDFDTRRNLLPQYLDLLAESRKYGQDKDMDKALEILNKAIELMPEKEDARWGLASALLHLERHNESIVIYEKLINDFPDNARYQFEYGQVLILAGKAKEGFEQISSAMSKTPEFDHFLGALAKLYADNNLIEEAKKAAEIHLVNYPHDIDIKNLLDKM